MPHDEDLAGRLRALLSRRRGVVERRMFGGLAFLKDGHMVCGVVEDQLCLRLGREGAAEALERPHVREMDFTGKVLSTMVYVEAPAMRTREDLRAWVERGLAFVATLPPKA